MDNEAKKAIVDRLRNDLTPDECTRVGFTPNTDDSIFYSLSEADFEDVVKTLPALGRASYRKEWRSGQGGGQAGQDHLEQVASALKEHASSETDRILSGIKQLLTPPRATRALSSMGYSTMKNTIRNLGIVGPLEAGVWSKREQEPLATLLKSNNGAVVQEGNIKQVLHMTEQLFRWAGLPPEVVNNLRTANTDKSKQDPAVIDADIDENVCVAINLPKRLWELNKENVDLNYDLAGNCDLLVFEKGYGHGGHDSGARHGLDLKIPPSWKKGQLMGQLLCLDILCSLEDSQPIVAHTDMAIKFSLAYFTLTEGNDVALNIRHTTKAEFVRLFKDIVCRTESEDSPFRNRISWFQRCKLRAGGSEAKTPGDSAPAPSRKDGAEGPPSRKRRRGGDRESEPDDEGAPPNGSGATPMDTTNAALEEADRLLSIVDCFADGSAEKRHTAMLAAHAILRGNPHLLQ